MEERNGVAIQKASGEERSEPLNDLWENEREGLVTSSRLTIATVLIAALHAPAVLFADFLYKERRLASGAGLGDRTIPQRIFAFRIVTAGKERSALLRSLLHQITAAIGLRTLDAQGQGFRGFTLWIGRAGDELPESSGLHHHGAIAFIALLISGNFFLGHNFDRPVRQLLEVLGILTRRIVLIGRAGEKLAVPSPFDFQHPAALLAWDIGRWLDDIFGARNRLGTLHFHGKRRVKISNGRDPLFISLFDGIQLFFEL